MGISKVGNTSSMGLSTYFNTNSGTIAANNGTKDIYTVVGRGKLKSLNYSTQLGYSATLEIVVDGVVLANNNPGYIYLDSTQYIYKVFHGEVNFRTSLIIRGRNANSFGSNSMNVSGVVEIF